MPEFQVTMETEKPVAHASGDRRKGIRVFRLEAADKDEAKSLAEQSAREERAQRILGGANEKTEPLYKVKRTESV